VLTVPTPSVAPALQRFLERDLPVFVNKPAAATGDQLRAIDTVAREAPHRVLSTSVLRFAPALQALDVKAEEVIAAHVTVRHDVGLWARGHNPWQDDPAVGGGMLVTMGVHGVELLISRFGPDVELAGAATAKRHYPQLVSEDSAVLALRWAGGPPASVTFIGAAEAESYELVLHTTAGEHRVTLAGGAEPEVALGYRGTLNAFLSMVGGAPSPVPWEETRAVLSILIAARRAG
jgi:predicted dehydrogenase